MVAAVSSSGLGLYNSSLSLLGSRGGAGTPEEGGSNERVFVNTATGNLILQTRDEFLSGRGTDLGLVRTYNSQGLFDDDNGDNWRLSVHQRLHSRTGAINTDGSTITKEFGDGANIVYTYAPALQRYVSSDGDGAHDTLAFDSGTNQWTWTDGSARVTETYDANGRLTATRDTDGNALDYFYSGDLLERVTDSSTTPPQHVYFDYHPGTENLAAIRVVSDGVTQTLTRYEYDTSNRLTEVRVDLSPSDNSAADGDIYVTTYTYDGTSRRVASISQGDGVTSASTVHFTYVEQGGVYRLHNFTDGEGRVTTYTYSITTGPGSSTTTVNADTDVLTVGETETTYTEHYLNTEELTHPSGTATPPRLYSDIPIHDFSGSLNSRQVFRIEVPEGASALYVGMNGSALGDGDLYLSRETIPRYWNARYASTSSTNNELIEVLAPEAGTWYLTVEGFRAFSDATLFASVKTGTDQVQSLTPGVAVTGMMLPGDGSETSRQFTFNVPAGTSDFRLTLGGTAGGDADMYIRHESSEPGEWPWYGTGPTSDESVSVTNPDSGTWTVLVKGFITDLDANLVLHLNAGANTPPSVEAGSDRSVASGAAVTLNGSASDAEGAVTYQWTQVSGPSVTLSNATSASASFTAPAVSSATTLRFRLTATDSNGLTNTDEVTVLVGASVESQPNLWAAPSLLETSSTSASNLVVGASQDGFTTAVWQEGSTLYARTYNPITHTWSAAVAVSGTSTSPVDVTLTVAEGLGHAVLAWRDSANGQIRANRLIVDPETGTFAWQGSELMATVTGAAVSDLRTGINENGLAAVTWTETSGSTNTVMIRRREGSSSSWMTAETVTTTTDPLDSVGLYVAEGDDVQLVWRQGSGSGYVVMGRTIDDGVWKPAVQISTAPGPVEHLGVKALREDPVIFWAEGDVARAVYGSGTDWAPLIEQTASGIITSLDGFFDHGFYNLAWTTANGLVEYGSEWDCRTIAAGNSPTDVRAFRNDHGRAVISWRDGNDFWSAAFEQGSWTGAQRVMSAPGATNAYAFVSPPLGEDHDDEGFALWLQNDGGVNNVYTANYEFSLPYGEDPYYTVQEGDSWESIALALYGTSGVAGSLADSLDNPTLTAGLRLYGVRGELPAEVITPVPPYYTVPAGATWDSITQAIYGTSDPEAVAALQAITGSPVLDEGMHLTVPLVLEYDGGEGGTATYVEATITDALGHQTVLVSDAEGRLVSVSNPSVGGLALERQYEYDSAGNVTRVVEDAEGLNRETTFEYDSNGNLTLTRDALGNTVERTYGAANELLTETRYTVPDPDGAGTAGQPSGALTTRYVYDAENHLRFVVSADGRVAENRYNAAGLLTSTRRYADAVYDVTSLPATTALTVSDLVTWSGARDFTKLELVEYTYDFRGNVSTSTAYAAVDVAGVPQTMGASVTRFVYDQRGRLLSSIRPRGELTASTPNDYITTHVYDGLGRETLNTVWVSSDRPPVPVSTEYNDALNTATVTFANGLVRVSTFNDAGELTTVAYSGPGATALGTTTYTYDAAGRLRFTTDPTGQRQHILYDEANRKVGEVDADGTLTEFVYDGANQLIKTIVYADRLTPATIDTLIVAGQPANVSLASLRQSLDSIQGRDPAQDKITRAVYDDAGRQVYSIDEVGAVTQFFYDGAGRITDEVAYATPFAIARTINQVLPQEVTVALSGNDRRTRHFYDNAGNRVGLLDAEGYLTELTYDAAGRLSGQFAYADPTEASRRLSGTLESLRPAVDNETTFDPERDVTSHFFYDGQGRRVGVLDGEGYLTETAYDADGNVSQTTRYDVALAYSTGATLDSLRQLVPGEAVRHITSYAYDGAGRLVGEINFEGTESRYGYDDVGNLTFTKRAVDTSEQRTTQARYDLLGRVVAELTAEGSAQITAQMSQAQIEAIWDQYAVHYSYDMAGRRTSATDQNGHTTYFYYDADGRRTHVVNAEGQVTETTYDARGRITGTRQYSAEISTSGLAGGLVSPTLTSRLQVKALDGHTTTTYAYTPTGQEVSTTSAEGASVTRRLNAFGDEVTRLEQIDASAQRQVDLNYDRRGLLLQTTAHTASGNRVETRAYDAFGREIRHEDQYGNVRKTEYDRLGRTLATVDPLTNRHTWEYDAFGRVLKSRDAFQELTSYQYIDSARSVAVTTPEGITVTTIHNRHGQTLTVTDGRNNVTSYSYDANGQLASVSDPLGALESRTYDRAGRLQRSVDARLVGTTFTYDAVNRVLTRTVDSVAGAPALVTTYAYDDAARVMDVTDSEGVLTRTEYDRDGRVESVTIDPDGPDRSQTVYAYDRLGNTILVTEGAGSPHPRRTKYVYDTLGRRIEEIVDPTELGGTLHLRTQYRYDANGNVTRKIDARGYSTWYIYDQNDRLQFTIDALGGLTENVYDAEGRVGSVIRYASVLTSRPTEATDRVLPSEVVRPDATGSRREHRIYDRDGREVYVVRDLGAGAEVTEKQYDRAGNVTRTRVFANPIASSNYATISAVESALASAGNSVATVSSGDRVEHTAYDARGRATFSVDALGGVTRREFDGNGNVIAVTQFANAGPTGTSDEAVLRNWVDLNPSAISDDNRVTRTWYDAGNRAVLVLDAEGYATRTVHDDANRRATTIAYTAKQTIGAGVSLQTAIDALIVNAATDQSTVMEYDAAGRLKRVYDAEHGLSATVYEEYGYDAVGNKISFRNRKGSLWTYEYDANGRLTHEHSPPVAVTAVTGGATLGASDNPELSIVTYLEYDALGNVTARHEAYGTTQVRVTRYRYDELGRQVRTDFPAAGVYDPALDSETRVGNQVVRADDDDLPLFSEVAYDALGNAFRSRDVSGYYSYKVYDRAGRVQYEVDAENYLTEHVYDTFGNETQLIRYASRLSSALPNNTASLSEAEITSRRTLSADDRTIAKTYDRLNRVKSVALPAVLAFVPNLGSPGGRTFTASPTTFYAYNAFGQVIRESRLVDTLDNTVVDPNVTPNQNAWVHDYFYYDELGQKVATVNALGYLTEYEYDETGDVTKQIEYAKALTSWSATSYSTPTPATRSLSVDDPLGYDREVRYAYDRLNRKVSETRYNVEYTTISGSSATQHEANLTTTFGYDVLGNQTRVTDSSGASTYTYYDALGRVRAIAKPQRDVEGAVAAGGNPITTLLIPLTEMKRDAFGNLVEQIEYASSATAVSEFGYTAGSQTGARMSRMLLDAYGRAIQTQDAMYAQRYASYNARGDVAKEWQPVTDADGVLDVLVTIYQYDKLGNRTATVEPQTLGQNQLIVRKQAKYNAFGEIYEQGTNDAWQEKLAYDAAGRVWRTNSGDGVYKIYLYDLAGNATAEIRSKELDLSSTSYTSAVAAGLTTQRLRTETLYDALGRVTAQRLPTFTTTSGRDAITSTFSIGQVAGPSNPAAIYQQLTVDYGEGPIVIYVVNPTATLAQGGGYYLTSSGTYEQDPNHSIVNSVRITWDAPTDSSIEVTFGYRPLGSSGAYAPASVVTLADNKVGVNVQSLVNQTYEYQVLYRRRADAVAYAEATGSFRVDGGSTASIAVNSTAPDPASEVAGLSASYANGALQWAAPADTSVEATVRVRFNSPGHGWNNTTALRIGGTFYADIGASIATAGNYQYQIVYTRNSVVIAQKDGDLYSYGAGVTRTATSNLGGPSGLNLPVVADISLPVGQYNGAVGASIASSEDWVLLVQGNLHTWDILYANTVNLNWPNLGSGQVRVEIDYLTRPWKTWFYNSSDQVWDEQDHAAINRTYVSGPIASAATGTSVQWTTNHINDGPGIQHINAVRVYLETSPGVFTLQYAQANPTPIYGRNISWSSGDGIPTFEWAPANTASYQPLTVSQTSPRAVNLDSFLAGTYEYRIRTWQGGRVTAERTGQFTISNSPAAVTISVSTHQKFDPLSIGTVSMYGAGLQWSYAKEPNASVVVEYQLGYDTPVYSQTMPGSGPAYNVTFHEAVPGGQPVFWRIKYFRSGQTDPYAGAMGSFFMSVTDTPYAASFNINSQTPVYPSGLQAIPAPSTAGDYLVWSSSGANPRFFYSVGAGAETELATEPYGSGFRVNLATVPAGVTFNYRVTFTSTSAPNPYAQGKGTFNITRSSTIVGFNIYPDPASNPPSTLQSPKRSQTLDRWGNVISATDTANQTTHYRYDQLNQMLEVKLPEADVTDTSDTEVRRARERAVSRNYYDALGRLIGTSDANGNLNKVTLNAAGQTLEEIHADGGIKRFRYDAFGNQVFVVDELGFHTSMAYDLENRLTSVWREVSKTDTTRNFTESYGYDQAGRRITETNGENETTRYFYDLNGNLRKRRTALGHETTYEYDAQGRKTREQNAIGGVLTWLNDYWGKVLTHTDLGDIQYTYSYNFRDGQLSTQTSTEGQHIAYVYDEANQLTQIDDLGTSRVTTYGYDFAGRRIRERTRINGLLHQDVTTSYDELGRIKALSDLRYALTYKYDAQGNRTQIYATYYGHDEVQQIQDLWYKYDSMNRVKLSQAQNVFDVLEITETQGIALTYDAAGQRKTALSYGSQVIVLEEEEFWNEADGGHLDSRSNVYLEDGYATETYTYDGVGRLTNAIRTAISRFDPLNGPTVDTPWSETVSLRDYDKASRQVSDANFFTGDEGMDGRYQVSHYDDDGRLTSQTTAWGGSINESSIVYNYDDADVLRSYTVTVYNSSGQAAYSTQYTNSFHLRETYLDAGQSAQSTPIIPGTLVPNVGHTVRTYNVNNELASFRDTYDADRNRYFANGANGQPLTVVQGNVSNVLTAFSDALTLPDNRARAQHFFFANGQAVGSFGQVVDADGDFKANFDVNYTPVSPEYPDKAPQSVIAQRGDTPRIVAARVFGDPNLWYLIAEENGRTSPDDEFEPGTIITIPNEVVSLSNSAGSFKPFDASAAIGDTTPTQPPPPMPKAGKKGCGIIGQIIILIIVIIVTIYTAGAAAGGANAALAAGSGSATAGSTWAAGTAALTGGLASTGTAIGAAAVGGAVGSAVGQGLSIAAGYQSGFDWKGVALGAIGSGVTAGLGAVGLGARAASALNLPAGAVTKYGEIALQAAAGSAITQGVAVATGVQSSFSWREVAITAVSAPISAAVGARMGPLASSITGRLVHSAFNGKVDVVGIATDVFGYALGNSVAANPGPSSAAAHPIAASADGEELTEVRITPQRIVRDASGAQLTNNPSGSIAHAGQIESPDEVRNGSDEPLATVTISTEAWNDEKEEIFRRLLSGPFGAGGMEDEDAATWTAELFYDVGYRPLARNRNASVMLDTFSPWGTVKGVANFGIKIGSGLWSLPALGVGGVESAYTVQESVRQAQFPIDTSLAQSVLDPLVKPSQVFLEENLGVGGATIVNASLELGSDLLGLWGGKRVISEVAPAVDRPLFAGSHGGRVSGNQRGAVGDLNTEQRRTVPPMESSSPLAAGVEGPSATRPVGDLRSEGLKDAHHVIQDAAVRDLPGYDTNAAPGVQLEGPSTLQGTPHYEATQAQRQTTTSRGTYGAERQIAYDSLRAAGYSDGQAINALLEADRYFRSIGVTENTLTRTPGERRR